MRFLLLLFLVAGCGDALPAPSFIDKLRVLAVQAEPPEVAPGTTTHVRPLVVQPMVKAADVQAPDALWLACRTPPGALQELPCGVDQTTIPPLCSDAPSAPVCILGSGLELDYTPEASGEILLTLVVADNGTARQCLKDIQANGGKPRYPDRCVVGLKRLVVNGEAGAKLNQNPLLESLTLGPRDTQPTSLTDGSARFPLDGSTMVLHVQRAANSAEVDAKGNYETLIVSWFTTSGKIDGGRSDFDVAGCASPVDCPTKDPGMESTTSWIAAQSEQLSKTADDTMAVQFWAVVRDDHGGVSWLSGSATPSE